MRFGCEKWGGFVEGVEMEGVGWREDVGVVMVLIWLDWFGCGWV